MTDDRKIEVLAPRARRQGAAHALKAAERETPARVEAATVAAPVAGQADPKPRRKRTTKPKTADGKVQLTADVEEELRGRARAAFRYARFYEHVGTFSEFVANAIEAEIRRIEVAHNGGERLQAEKENLPAGRPTSR